MLFNSYIFILLFLPLTLTGYFACNAKGRYAWGKLWLLAMSLWFYAWFNIRYLPVITGSILGNYLLYRLILGERGRPERKRRCLYLTAAGSAANLGVLFYYKYFDFFLENLNALFHADLAFRDQLLYVPAGGIPSGYLQGGDGELFFFGLRVVRFLFPAADRRPDRNV